MEPGLGSGLGRTQVKVPSLISAFLAATRAFSRWISASISLSLTECRDAAAKGKLSTGPPPAVFSLDVLVEVCRWSVSVKVGMGYGEEEAPLRLSLQAVQIKAMLSAEAKIRAKGEG